MLDFEEVNNRYTREEALKEAKRCLGCKKPSCQAGCPIGMPMKDIIAFLKEEKVEEAASLIYDTSNLPNICSIVCPHEKQCTGHCILNKKGAPIQTGKLEKFIVENVERKKNIPSKKEYHVAVIGAGPAGISCALELSRKNINVTIFEKEKKLGGMLTYAIPTYRLAKTRLNSVIDELKENGVKIITNSYLSYEDIINIASNNDRVFIATGLQKSKSLGINGTNANGYYDALDVLKSTNKSICFNEGELPKLSGKTVVVGAGNVAMDASRTALRLGSEEVLIIYRRSIDEAPACKEEIEEAKKDGVLFKFLCNPVEIICDENKNISGIVCEEMILGEKDSSGRARPIGSGNKITITCQNVIGAIGQEPDKNMKIGSLFENDYGYIEVLDNLETSRKKIYAGGDIVLGASTVVEAMSQGKKAAIEILKSLKR